ncbi:MAG: FG-GAP-like repeat-containing protein [Limisphaerales bacterium]
MLCLLFGAAVPVSLRAVDCVSAPSGLVGWWAGNGNAKDTAGGNDGALAGDVSFLPGEAGLAFNFTGGGKSVVIPDSAGLELTNQFTIEAWVNPATLTDDSHGGGRGIVSKVGGSGGANGYQFGFYGGYTNLFGQFNTPGQAWPGYQVVAQLSTPLKTNAWVHVAWTYDQAAAMLYLNGVPVATNVIGPHPVATSASNLRISADDNGNLSFDGLIDEVSIYNRALTATEIQAIYNAGSAGKCAPITSPGVTPPYLTDFENGVGPEWGVPVLNSSETLGFTLFSGRFDNTSQWLTLTNLVPGQSYTLGFDLYVLDSWDGNGGPDFFNVAVNGIQVFHETFSNYNGNPPNSPQSYPGQPDEGRANLGFTPSYVDAIYRNLEITFQASNTVSTIAFSGQNLQNVDDESWGVDNVGVRLTSSLTNTFIRSTSLPLAGSTNSVAIETFTISANSPLLAATVTNAANFTLREAGADGTLGTSDDASYTLTPSVPGPGGRSVAFAFPNAPLQPGHYRFQTTTGLQDTNSSPVPVFTRDFFIANPVGGVIETPGNDTLALAVPLPMTESPAGSHFFTAFAVGTFISTSDVDYWRFDAEAGDVLTVRLESESQGVYPHLRLRNTADQDVASADGDSGGTAQMQNVTIGTPGTYYLRVWSNNNRSRYWMRVDQSRGPQMESESNDSQGGANVLNLAISPGLYQGRIVGSLPAADSAGDFFSLGTLNVGNAISVSALFPAGSTLTAGQTALSVQVDGNPVALITNTTGSLNYTVVSNGVHYLHVECQNRNLRAQYLLNVTVSDGVPPVVTGTSLPNEGATTTAIIDRFTLAFSEDIYVPAITNPANYELRGAGPDGALGTGDDTFYSVATTGYASGLVAPYTIVDGPLQPGNYRLTVRTNIQDRAANRMTAPFVRNFTVAGVAGYVMENRNNDAGGLATPLTFTPSAQGDGTIGYLGGSAGTAASPQGIAAGHWNGDTNLDLVTANWNGGNITVLTNNGKGVFQALTNIATGGGAVGLAVADFNNDGMTDIAVANYNAGTVSILRGNANGTFQLVTNIGGFSAPYNLAAADLNGDGRIDLVVPSYNSGNVSVLFGNGDGTFLASSNYATGNNPQTVAVGDLNGDGKPDLAAANYGSATVSVLTNNGNGTFQTATNIPVGRNPNYVAIGDVGGDSIPDLVVLQYGDNSVSVLAGNGNGTFRPRLSYFTGTQNAYQLLLTDLNGDGRSDIVVPGYGNNQLAVLLNNGTGVFTNLYNYATSYNPIGVAAGDFNNDGRTDLAFVHYNGNYVSIWAGNPSSVLAEDPPGSGLRTALARGTRSNSSDVDYYQFSASAGDQVILAVDVPGNPPQSSLNYQILREDGSVFTTFTSDYTGWGQSGIVTLPQTGTYLVRVASNYDYQGEYRIRLTIARPPLQLEGENNGSIGQANPVTLTRTNNHLQGSIAGYLGVGDGAGDYYSLGNLLGGASLNLNFKEPATSGLAEILWIYNSAGVFMTNSTAGAASFTFTVPTGQDGIYYVQVTAAPGGFATSSDAALRFSGGSDYVDLGNWFNYQTFTLSMWVNPGPSQNGYADIMDNNHQSGINWVIQQDSGNNNHYFWGPQDGSPGVPFTLTPNVWQHLAITRDSTNISSVYINGTLVGNVAAPGQINYDGSQFLRIGRWGGGGRNWTGLFDELRIWNRSLSPAEIIAGMTGQLTGTEANLAGYWPFNEGYGTNSVDLTASNHPAALVNGLAWTFLSTTNARPPGLQAQYVLSFDLTNPVPPTITGVTLPADGTTTTTIISSFSVSFSEDMDPTFNALARTVSRYNNHSYVITDYSTTWWNAEALALSLGGHLAAITNAAENSWINQTFSGYGDLWIGLNDMLSQGTFVWTSNDPSTYSNWSGGEPNNSNGYESAVRMYGNGTWDDYNPNNSLRGVIEVAGTTDTDGDGLVDSLDPFPNDRLNAFDLRAAGPDGVFDTADDIVYRIYPTGYASGLSAPFAIADGPLQAGNYRFKITTSLKDRFGNPLAAPFVRNFVVAPVNGLVEENRRGASGTSVTSLSLNPGNQLDGSFSSFTTLSAGRQPQFIARGLLNADTNLDLVTANLSDGNITVFLGDGTGAFQAATNISTGSGAISVAPADFNGDHKLDLAVANYYAGTVTILIGDGNGGFQILTNYAGFSNPMNLAAADFNKDGRLDLVVPNWASGTVTVLFGNGDGTFQVATNYTVGSQPQTVAVGDLNGDGQPDLAVANYNSSSVSVLLGNSDGTFQPAIAYANAGNTRYITLGDVNGDGILDVVAIGGSTLSVFPGKGDGTFPARADYSIGSADPYQVALADLNGDGKPDAIVASYGNNRLITVLNNGDGTFGPAVTYNLGGNPISVAAGDYNSDGRLDLAIANYNGNSVSILLGNNTESLALDPAGTGLRIGGGRGNLADSGDLDYWSFSAQSGDRLFVASENPGNPANASLLYRIYNPDGSQWTYFYSDYNGRGQISLVVPVSGTCMIRVEPNNQYYGEYRLRLTLASAPVQMEVEDNSSIGNANALTFALSGGRQNATVLGYIGNADTSGDYYQLGNLADGTQVTLGLSRPASSALAPELEIYNASGILVTNNQAGQTNLIYTIGTGNGGAYYAHVIWTYPSRSSAATNALLLNGGNNYINVGNWAPGPQWSVQAWVLPGSLPGGRHTVAGAMNSCQDWGLALQDGRFGTVIRPPGGCSATLQAPTAANAGTWYHVASVSDGTNAYLYVNGVLMASGPVDPNYTPTAAGTWIGGEVCCGNYFPGVIQDVSIWNRPLSQTEVANFMANSPSGGEAGLLGYWRLQDGSGSTVPDLSTNGHNGTLVNGPAWTVLAPVGSIAYGVFQQYLLNISLLNTTPPQIVSVSLPGEGTTSSNVLDRFSIVLSEDFAASTVTNAANYELRSAGPDNLFGTADDQLYTVLNSPAYSSGTSASYLVSDGPLQPGSYRFTVRTNLTDRIGTFLQAPYLRNFAVANVPGFVFENRFDNSPAFATTLSVGRTNRADGSFIGGQTLGLGNGIERLAAGRINGDTNVDLVAALWQSGNVAVLLGNGDGSFQVKTNYATGSQAWSVALGYFNTDSNLDLAVGNYGANTVTVLTGNGDGTFQVRSNYAVGATPYHVLVADFNKDGKVDLAVPNYGSGNVSLLLGNGDGTFQGAVNYAAGRSPMYIAAGDINGDGNPDLVVANYGDNNVSLLFGNGNGTFAPALGIATGLQPRALALVDLNNDGKLDLAVFNSGDNTVSVMFGNGDGSFQPRVNYAVSTSDGYEILATDLNGDGWRDLVVNGYNNNTVNVLLNRGDGTFQPVSAYSIGNRPVGLVAADFNNDGRVDLAVGNDSGQSVSVLLGNDTEPLPSDSATGLRISAGRGNLYNGSELDYWSFDALAGDRLSIASDNPGNPANSSLLYRIYDPDGSQWTYFYSDYSGRGQISLVVPASGTYTIRVEPNNQYYGEYRVRVTLARPPVQLEAENNDSIGNANPLNFTLSGGHQQATELGYISSADPGDFYLLGNLSSNSVITLNLQQPASSGFADALEIYNPAGTLVTGSAMGAPNLTYTVPFGADGAYYARVRGISGVLPPAQVHATGSTNTLFYVGGNSYSEVMIDIPESALAVSFWFRTLDPNAGLFSVSAGAIGSGGHDRHIYLNGGNIYTRIYSAGAVGSSGLSLADGAWHHLVFTYGSDIGGNKTYVDGVAVASGTKASSDFNWQDRIDIGYSEDAPNRSFSGDLDEVRLWNRAFTPADVLNNMTNSLTGTEAGLIGYWRFNEGTGTTALDLTTNAHNATLVNGPVWMPVNYGFAGPGIFAQYLLSIDLKDTVPPVITSVTLPAAGSTNSTILDHFTLNFSKDVDPSLNALNRLIRLYNGHAYTVSDSSTTWYNAETQARSLGGHLATIDGASENAWVLGNFSGFGNFWIGLTDEAQKGNFLWASGDSVRYTNWSGGTPDNSNNKDYTAVSGAGTWANYTANTTYRGVIEVGGPDSDGDGIPDTLDPYPNDPYNLFDLRSAGADGVFDTADDQIYHLTHANYTGGLSLDFSIADGPLQPGAYRFTVTSSLSDRFGNPAAAPFTQYFAVGNVPGYVMEGRTNNTPAGATSLTLVEDPPGMKTAAGRGNLSNNSEVDYWSFNGTAGDLFNMATFIPGSPGASQLHYQVYKPDGSLMVDLYPSYNGDGQSAGYTLPTNGIYLLAVSVNYGYYGEYRFRVTVATPPLQMEREDNGSIANANTLTFAATTNAQSASVVGNIRTTSDLDYFSVGTVSNGYSIFLNVRLPGSSTLLPIVSVYNSAGVYQNVATGSQPNAAVANVPITATGSYYALVRAGNGTGGLKDQYVLDVNTVPTGSLNFPNLVVSPVSLPSGSGILSGQPVTYSFTVQNLGPVATAVASWIDRAVFSPDQILGNTDDLPLGFFPHTGVLNPNASYSVTNTFTLPDGISGDFYMIVQTDAGNAVNEYLYAANKVMVSTNTFHVNLAPYPDLTVENLKVAGPDLNNAFTVTWNTANRGNGATPAPFYESFLVRDQTTGNLLVNSEQPVTSVLAPNGTLARSQTVTVTNAGVYQVQVVTDSRNSFYEYNPNGAAAALANNTAVANFQIIANFNVTVQSSPPGAGLLTGAGSYASGAAVTVTAAPDTHTLPYLFVNWTEGGAFQSASTNYTFLISRDRTLTANFTLPAFLVSASNSPPAAGAVSGQGSYFYGTTNVLTANANFGYRFTNWTENSAVIGTANALTLVVTNNRFLVAHYVEANTVHVVTTATSPENVASVTGAGSYTNGQTATISAPLSVTNPPNAYTFREFRQNGAFAGNSASFNKSFSTLDPTNLQFVASYDTVSLLPLITNVVANYPGPVPATTNFTLSFQFNRSMNTNFTPLVVLTNSAAPVQAAVPPGGAWSATVSTNDTFSLPPVTFGAGMDGTNGVLVSSARDLNGGQLALTNVMLVVVDVTPPPNPVLTLVSSNNSSATVSWTSYTAPPDLNNFRIYLSTAPFTSVTGLTAVSSAAAGTRSFTYSGLTLDQPYYAAVAAVDNAGNRSPAVTPLAFTLSSTVPPPVPVQVTAAGPSSAMVSWNSYDTSALLGFAGFQLYYEASNFTSAAGHTAKQTLGADTRSVQIDNLDRTKTYYFAVVGFNGKNAFNSNVTTATWSDPFAGNLAVSLTIGGAGQSVVDILHSVTVVNDAVVTIPAGTTLRFAPGAGLIVQQGAINANGTPLDPIIFTSANDQPGLTPAAGDWNGLTLGAGAGSSLLRHVFVKYAAGLTLSNCSPTVDAFTALNNAPAGLTVENGAALNTSNALLAFNGIGAQQLGSAQLTLINSSIKNNGTNALASGGASLRANQDWWGSATPADIDALLQGVVDRSGFLVGEPLLTPAIGTSNNVTQVGRQSVDLRLACRTADSMRLSEDSTFTAVFFTPFTNNTPFQLSNGGGQKSIFAQFRSVTGQTSPPVSIAVTYITAGPAIASFNLDEGQVLARPLVVTGSATAPLGMASMEFYVDGIGQGTNAGGSFSQWFDVRNFSSAVHRVELIARDTSGSFSTVDHNVIIAQTPPSAPQITVPFADLVVRTNGLLVRGTAEPFVGVRLLTDAAVLGLTSADASGNFSFTNVSLVEGANNLVAAAFDANGSAASSARSVVLETVPPAQLVMEPPSYSQSQGLYLAWHFPAAGKRATSFQVFWGTNAFTNVNQAVGQSQIQSGMTLYLQLPAPGTYYFSVVGYDDAGNVSPLSALISYYYDPFPPSFSIAFNKSPPVGVGPIQITLSASKALAGTPSLILLAQDGTPVNVPVTNVAFNAYLGLLNVTPFTPSGVVRFTVSAQDVAGNVFNGAPSGPTLTVDVDPPFGVISTLPTAPIQVTNTTNVAVSLVFNKPAQPGAAPQLTFNPPVGSPVQLALSGADTNWNASLTLLPSMGSGNGTFSLTVTDALANVGHLITSGRALEIYNTALPTPPGQPIHFEAVSLAGGRVQLTWSNVPNAEIYRVYSETGTTFVVPTVLVADNLATNSYIDLPPADGSYRYVVTASRRGSEGTNSIVRVAVSDRTPPPAPANVAVQLVATGLQVTWQAGAGETPDHYNIYRNGTLISTVRAVAPLIDSPPRGVLNYTVGADDALGNEALGTPASIQLLVSAVNNLLALVNAGQAPQLSWTSTDATTVGFNVYRNGVKQNSAPLPQPGFVDALGVAPGSLVNYSVTSLNATNAESAARTVNVYDVGLDLSANNDAGGAANPLVNRWFDNLQLLVSNSTANASLVLASVEVRRTSADSQALTLSNQVNLTLVAGDRLNTNLVFPAASTLSAQSMRVRAIQQTDVGGSSVIYQGVFDFPNVVPPGTMVEVSANQQPLSGGLAQFNVQVFNRGYAPMDLVVTRNNGSDPGDLYISLINGLGQEVSRMFYNGIPSGTIFQPDGTGILRVAPGGSASIAVSNVLVPASLGTNSVFFQAAFDTIYYSFGGAGQLAAGPLSGGMASSLSLTPYYGTAQTDRQLYANDDPVVITGQALDRTTGQPVTNAALKIGFFTRGYRFYQNVTTDGSGNYQYTYNPPPGLSGTLAVWAAHPDVFDVLNQAQITIYRLYASPAHGDIRMTRNDTLPFSINLINPGDATLTAFNLDFHAYRMQGTNSIAITNISGILNLPPDFTLGPHETKSVNLALSATLDAPDTATVQFNLRSAEGAVATFSATVSLLPALPLITVVDPAIGYVEVSVNRGDLRSSSVTIVNRGLRDLKGVTLTPPTNVAWMSLNLPVGSDGLIHLPDMPVGATNGFMVVFNPPADATLDYHNDSITIQGTNAPSPFVVKLYALVTSNQKGAVQVFVDDILTYPVPGATVRIKNTILGEEYTTNTDVNGYVTIPDLQEGDWAWQASAPGHSANVGVVSIIGAQTVQVDTRLSRSLVTVNFVVEPVPFTDRYEITIEQTFETHVPAPVLVVSPALTKFENVGPGFEATFIAVAKNEGLIEMRDLTITGQELSFGTLTPLITYVPVLLPQQSIEIPFRATYTGAQTNTPASGPKRHGPRFDTPGFADCATGGLAGLADFLQGINAICNANADCADLKAALKVMAGVAVLYSLTCSPTFSPLGFLPTPCPSIPFPISFVINLISCIAQQNLSAGPGGGGSGGGGDGPIGTFTGYGGGPPACFVQDTSVWMADGVYKPIEHVKVGDWVRTDSSSAKRAFVKQVTERVADDLFEIRFTPVGTGQAERTITATGDHAFWVDGQGWTLSRSLRLNQWLTTSSGKRAVIASLKRLSGPRKVYSLVLREDHAFFANDVLVRDRCGLPWPGVPQFETTRQRRN